MASNIPYDMDLDEDFIDVIDLRTDKPNIFLKKESMGSEKQISVDPISLREPSNPQQLVMNPPTTCPTIDVMIPRRTNLGSLPNSVSSSPRVIPKVPKKTSKKHSHSIAVANLDDRMSEIHLQRSKSCGQGRASEPPEDFDNLNWVTNKTINVQKKRNDEEYTNHHINNSNNINDKVNNNVTTLEDGTDTVDEKFKCKALCLYLPAFGKVKPVRARRQSSDVSQAKESETGHVVSKRVSLEKFECASLDSSGLINDDDEDTSNLFFDLPLELIKCSINDTDSPVTTGFLFDKEHKGVLKNSTSKLCVQSKSTDLSARQASSPTSYPRSPTFCVTLEAQSA